jgi:hypothetical protein
MRPLAAWLALNDEQIFREILVRNPELLLTQGDPGSLSLSQREALLKAFAFRFRGSRRPFSEGLDDQVERLADPKEL